MGWSPRCAASALAAIAVAWATLAAAQDGGAPADAEVEDAGAPEVVAPPPAQTPDGEPLPAGVGPIVWAESSGRRCHRTRGRRICEGPRRVPVPSAEALERQRALGLDQPRAVHQALATPSPDLAAAVPTETPGDLLWPVQGGRLWRGYGMHQRLRRSRSGRMVRARGRRRHEGVDIGADPGTPILAANDGLVVYSDNGMSGYGNVVVIMHRDASTTLYAHCRATFVAAGELVRRGQIIAAVGATGLAHGPHLHFEWRVGGRTRDPLRRFVGRPPRPRPADAAEEAVSVADAEPAEPAAAEPE